tara:strand:+ start:126 stop:359 length:234 start_codon:yes stop_codon:yes gene_type:complete
MDTNTTRNNKIVKKKKKFSVGDIVTISGRGGTFHIYAEPSWSNEHKQWLYPYDYGLGGTSEGFGLEYNMKSVKNEKG